MTSFFFARVNATFTLRQSRSSSPTFFSALDRTKETMMQSLSLPWYLSTVWISIPLPVASLILQVGST